MSETGRDWVARDQATSQLTHRQIIPTWSSTQARSRNKASKKLICRRPSQITRPRWTNKREAKTSMRLPAVAPQKIQEMSLQSTALLARRSSLTRTWSVAARWIWTTLTPPRKKPPSSSIRTSLTQRKELKQTLWYRRKTRVMLPWKVLAITNGRGPPLPKNLVWVRDQCNSSPTQSSPS